MVNVSFNSQEEVKNAEHLAFPFKALSLKNLLSFSIFLIDENNKEIEFAEGENKINTVNLIINVFLS